MNRFKITLVRKDWFGHSDQFTKDQPTCPDVKFLTVLRHTENHLWRVVTFRSKSVCLQYINTNLFRKTKVKQFGTLVGDEDIGRFDIPMYQINRVYDINCFKNLLHVLESILLHHHCRDHIHGRPWKVLEHKCIRPVTFISYYIEQLQYRSLSLLIP